MGNSGIRENLEGTATILRPLVLNVCSLPVLVPSIVIIVQLIIGMAIPYSTNIGTPVMKGVLGINEISHKLTHSMVDA